ncbi:leucine-rich repeat-containing protein 71-like isoform X4 [Lineus longissimus]|uniref:leucine-rich repeat-containing protein 71-like isoform X4 n=1 Tax=Lineus longissimus TaxID=88925 RepID=UPI00315D566A
MSADAADFVKKVRMGKKFERALRDKAQSSSTQDQDDGDRTPEPHVCTGHFSNDFNELCQRNNMVVIPTIAHRPRRPPSPSERPPPDTKEQKKGDKNKVNVPIPEPEPEIELDENGEPIDPPPKTYTMKGKFEYFKPSIQVEQDHPDKQDTVTEIFIRGWKIDESMVGVFSKCFVTMEKLHSINFWNVGLTEETLKQFAAFLPNIPNLRSLMLDANPIKGENYFELIKEESPIQHLSLRHNSITDHGAKLLGTALGTVHKTNVKLISLNLNSNQISDEGATSLAGGLRFNRCLLSLCLANNKISDSGAKKLAEVLSRFALSHEEVIERRKLLSATERQKSVSPPPSGGRTRGDRDRPPSTKGSSSHTDKSKRDTKDKSTTGKKPGKDKKDDDTKGGTKKGKDATIGKKGGRRSPSAGTNDGRKERRASASGRGSGASIAADTKTLKGKDKGKGGKDKKATVLETEPSEVTEAINPLLEQTDIIDGEMWIPGNRALINLNLTRNLISEAGISELLKAVQYQTTLSKFSTSAGTGLMRICLHKNKVPTDNANYVKLADLMIQKDPFYKPPPKTPDEESTRSESVSINLNLNHAEKRRGSSKSNTSNH